MLVEGVESSGAKEASFHFTAYVPINGRTLLVDLHFYILGSSRESF
jgi:hypothetical protein